MSCLSRRVRNPLASSARLQPIADALFAPPVTEYRRRLKELLVRQGVLDAAYMRLRAAR